MRESSFVVQSTWAEHLLSVGLIAPFGAGGGEFAGAFIGYFTLKDEKFMSALVTLRV